MLCGACSTTPGLTLSATPNPLTGDGVTTATVTALVNEGGSPSQGAVVHFKSTLGSFAGAPAGTPRLVDVPTDDTGSAIATLTAPRQGFGTLQITASVSLQGAEPSQTVSLPLVPAGGPAASIDFSCTNQNIGGFVHNRQTDIHVLCRATARDQNGHNISNASVQTLSEAGTLAWLQDDQGVQEFVYTVRPDEPPPLDVPPLGPDGKPQLACPSSCNNNPFDPSCQGEPCWIDVTGITHNPRDGVATLLAAVPGVKGFDNVGEPYVDRDDSGVWKPGDPYIDYNGNGKYDPPDGQLKDHMQWKVYRMIWSGQSTIPVAGGGIGHDSFLSFTTSNKTSGTVTGTFFDSNLNSLAADGQSAADGIAFSAQCSGDGTITFAAPTVVMDQANPGISFAADTGKISAPGQRSTYTRNNQYQDGYSFTGTTGQTCTFSASPQRAYDPGAPGFPAQGTNPDATSVAGESF